jgi:hypothetical protein
MKKRRHLRPVDNTTFALAAKRWRPALDYANRSLPTLRPPCYVPAEAQECAQNEALSKESTRKNGVPAEPKWRRELGEFLIEAVVGIRILKYLILKQIQKS